MAGIALSQEAFKRIAAATRKVERTPNSLTGDRTTSHGTAPGFWAMLLGCDISGIKYTFNKVIFDPKSTKPEAFMIGDYLQFAFDGDEYWEAAIEVNATKGVPFGAIVWLTFAGYDVNDQPVYLFSHQVLDPDMPTKPHDHRDNQNGGFSFSTYHPGTLIPQMPWAM